jgi:hypothetical protein
METPGLPTTGAPDVVNPTCSWAYTAGQVAGVADAIAIAALGTAAAAGYEVVVWAYPRAGGNGRNGVTTTDVDGGARRLHKPGTPPLGPARIAARWRSRRDRDRSCWPWTTTRGCSTPST